jgi:hypothetical protein
MALTARNLPKSLKDVLKNTGKNYGENLNPMLVEVSYEGAPALKIDYSLGMQAGMFDMDDKTANVSSLKGNAPDQFATLTHRVGVHLFGDNMSEFYKDHPADKGDGSWEIVIDDFVDDDFWLIPSVMLVPRGI